MIIAEAAIFIQQESYEGKNYRNIRESEGIENEVCSFNDTAN